ncbi:hypothetical protein GPECTOR_90g526 [Gonium pectorale]|uniref:Uncharacterized protein n=1 Tax=Gonium pectorale TaxID=33097 RepID=A0A150G0R0_GONPE|nr:hypothetical protein GPECTOR_90g526 [Gonium pectorale]|eukprot:KXZ43439.1 hypothetical protein GPECTOR_90g526 [Gonium pectorale]
MGGNLNMAIEEEKKVRYRVQLLGGLAGQARTLLSSPCLAYLLSSHVVGLCAALDGGPTYGMPQQQEEEEARRRLYNAVLRVALHQAEDLGALALTCRYWPIDEWWYWTDSTCPPAVAASLGGSPGASLGAALGAYIDGVGRRHAAGGGVPRSVWAGLERLLAVALSDTDEGTPLPAQPTPCVAAALQAGYLPRLSAVLRSLLRGPEYLGDLLEPGSGKEWAWRQLLAFGPVRDSTAALDEAAELLQRAMRALTRPAGTSEGGADEDPVGSNLCTATTFA